MRLVLNALHATGKRASPANSIPLVHRFCSQGCGQAEHTTRKVLVTKGSSTRVADRCTDTRARPAHRMKARRLKSPDHSCTAFDARPMRLTTGASHALRSAEPVCPHPARRIAVYPHL